MPWKKGQRPRFIRESEATGAIAGVYQDIRQTLGLPFVPAPFLVYAAVPKFLELHWAALRPLAQTPEFFALAERIRGDGFTRAHSYFHVPDLCHKVEDLRFSSGARLELTDTIEVLHYKNPLMLLLLATQLQAFDRKVGDHAAYDRAARAGSEDHPRFTERPILIEEDRAPAPTRKLYEDIKRTTSLPFVTTDYLAMARWPDFLAAYWQVMRPIVESPIYSECCSAVRDTAWQMTRELPVAVELTCDQLTDAGMADEDVGIAVRITEMFVKNLGAMVLNISTAKIGLEGGSTAEQHLTPEELPIAA